ncbi:MAG TPA: hypothetical protein VKY73_07805 [Polyangiaceae bacterium]|nr:hypothetical protein [Polyangiaceae bacterium]
MTTEDEVRTGEDVQSTPPRHASRSQRVLIGAGVGIALLLGAYVFGRVQAQSEIDSAKQQTQAAEARAENERKISAGLRRDMARLEARRQLHLALLALDERNFGTAQQHLRAGAKLLSEDGSAPLGEIGKRIAEKQLVATEDVGDQRAQILAAIRTLDEQLTARK